MYKAIGLSIIVYLLSTRAVGVQNEEKEVKAQKKLEYEKEIGKRKAETPAEYEKTRRLMTFAAEMLLARLGYDVGSFDGVLDKKTQFALKAYQRNRSLPVTGDPLTFETFEQVILDTATLDHKPVGLPLRRIAMDSWESGYVLAQGTWTIGGEKMTWPEQTAKIECRRPIKVCTEATAIVKNDTPDPTLSLEFDTYEIERWDDAEIVAKRLQSGCVRFERRFNRKQKTVTGIRSATSGGSECSGAGDAEWHMVLDDGPAIWKKLSEEKRNSWRALVQLSPTLAKYIDSTR